MVPHPIERAFEFYGNARNLERITPPWLGFEVTTPGPIEMGVGTLIEYRLRLHRVPVRWRTRIEVWEPPRRFVDAQVKGPYSLWEHTHTFEEDGPEATVIRDGGAGDGYCCITAMTFPDGSSNQAIWGPGPRTMPFSSWAKPS